MQKMMRKKTLLVQFVASAFFATVFCVQIGGAEPLRKVCFSPGSCCKNNIIELCDRARSSIDVVIYRFTDRDIYVALVNAIERGVNVMLLLDETNIMDPASPSFGVMKDLLEKGATLYVSVKHSIIQHKFAIFDRKVLSTGSYNWTYKGAKNHEDCLLISDQVIIQEYHKYMQDMFAEGEVVRLSSLD
jgi:cardiolipin hydrolase